MTMFTQPTAIIVFGLGTTGQSAVAFDDNGEILETVTFDEGGVPQWHDEFVAVADHRGAGGSAGYAELVTALNAAEGNYKLTTGHEPTRVIHDQWAIPYEGAQ